MAMTCVICQHRETRTGMVCDPDRTRVARTLDEVVELYVTLVDSYSALVQGDRPGQYKYTDYVGEVHKGTRADPVTALLPAATVSRKTGAPVSGSRTPPLPIAVDHLDLTMPPRLGAVTDPNKDQVGEVAVAAWLDSWVQDWRGVLGVHVNPEPTVPALAAWLRTWLYEACDRHTAVDDFAAEMFALAGTLRRACGMTDVKPKLLDAECSRCDQRAMYRLPGEDRVECGGCGRRMTEDEYAQWTKMTVARLRSDMHDQVKFVRTMLDEDERVALAASTARSAATPGGEHWRWECSNCDTVVEITPVTILDEVLQCPACGSYGVDIRSVERYETSSVGLLSHMVTHDTEEVRPVDGQHMITWDPVRVLAEVAAKRAILDLYEDLAGKGLHPSAMAIMIRVVAQMVRPYAHRDGFQEEWRS